MFGLHPHMYTMCLLGAIEGQTGDIRFSGTQVIDYSEPHFGCWDLGILKGCPSA